MNRSKNRKELVEAAQVKVDQEDKAKAVIVMKKVERKVHKSIRIVSTYKNLISIIIQTNNISSRDQEVDHEYFIFNLLLSNNNIL